MTDKQELADAFLTVAKAAHEGGEDKTVAQIVAWLRGPTVPDHSDEGGCPFDKAAACIERGDWKDKAKHTCPHGSTGPCSVSGDGG